jgi:phosphate transport system substrate-binding protein
VRQEGEYLPLTNSIAAAQLHKLDTPATTLRIIGTDTMKDLLTRWITGFRKLHPEASVELTANGALTAAPALASGAADLVPLGRELTPSELVAFHEHHAYDPIAIPVALGSYDISGKTVALAFFVNAANPIQRLNFQQLATIYCGDQPSPTWSDLGVTGPLASQPVHPIGVNFPDGISNFIRLRICHDGTFHSGIREEHTGGKINVLDRIVSDVATDPAAIGYAGFANLKPDTKLVTISEGASAYLAGTRAEVASGSYPLTRTIYIFADRAPGKPLSGLVEEFLRYVTSPEGQSLVSTDGIYMPLPATQAVPSLLH